MQIFLHFVRYVSAENIRAGRESWVKEGKNCARVIRVGITNRNRKRIFGSLNMNTNACENTNANKTNLSSYDHSEVSKKGRVGHYINMRKFCKTKKPTVVVSDRRIRINREV